MLSNEEMAAGPSGNRKCGNLLGKCPEISQNPSAIIAIQQPSALVGADAAVALASPARPWPLQESIPRFSTLSSIAANLSQYIDYKWMIYGGYIRDVLMNARPQLTQRCQFHSSWRHRICLVDPFDSHSMPIRCPFDAHSMPIR